MFKKKKIKSKKGFTLIELLAVIVILAVIALIATPMILNAVETAKTGTIKSSAYGYLSALEYYVAVDGMDDGSINGAFDYALNKDNIKVKGTQPTNVDVTLLDGKVTNGSITFNNYLVMINDGEVLEIAKGPNVVYSKTAKVYGVAFSGATGTRTDSAVGQTVNVTASTITSSFNNEEIYNEITEVTDTYGNVFVKVPKFYISKSKTGANFTYKISKTKQDATYYLPYSFYDETTNTSLPYVLIGKYDASLNGTKLESKTGKAPLTNLIMSTVRTYAKNNNIGVIQGYQLLDIHAIDVAQTLFYVEFANLNSRSIMKGYTAGDLSGLLSGTTDLVPTTSGSPISNTSGQYAMKYRGIENLYGDVYQFIDGINIQNNKAYIATNPSSYAVDIFTGAYKAIGYTNSGVSGFVTEMGYDLNNPFVQLPILTGTNIYGDIYSQATGNKIVCFGVDRNSGPNDGLSTWDLSFSSGNTGLDLGSRLIKKAL